MWSGTDKPAGGGSPERSTATGAERQTPEAQELYLTTAEATARLAKRIRPPFTQDTVRRWARDGLIPAVRLPSGRYRIKASIIDRL